MKRTNRVARFAQLHAAGTALPVSEGDEFAILLSVLGETWPDRNKQCEDEKDHPRNQQLWSRRSGRGNSHALKSWEVVIGFSILY